MIDLSPPAVPKLLVSPRLMEIYRFGRKEKLKLQKAILRKSQKMLFCNLFCFLADFHFLICSLVFSSGIQFSAPQTLRSKRSQVNTQLTSGGKCLILISYVFCLSVWECLFFVLLQDLNLGQMCENKEIYKRKLFCCTLAKHRHFCRIYSS